MQIVDTHCHLDLDIFARDRDTIIQRARDAGVAAFILPGVIGRGWRSLLQLCVMEAGIYAAPGLHPMYLPYHDPTHLKQLEILLSHEKVVAVGEIGLDYFKSNLDKTKQQVLFESQLAMADAFGLPILLHVRKAHDQVLATIRRTNFKRGGLVHAYGGSLQQARQYFDLGFAMGIGGAITYERAQKIRTTAAELPAEALVLETDAPDIPVASHRNETNYPEYITDVLSTLSMLRKECREQVAHYTTANVNRILGIKLTC